SRAAEKSTSVSPKPLMSFRPSVPWEPEGGTVNAAGLRLLPPGAVGTPINCGCPGTKSGRMKAKPRTGETTNIWPLSGNPDLATTVESTDQPLVSKESIPDFAGVGTS